MNENIKLYPLKFHPILFEKIWGGTKLNRILNKKSGSGLTGESWELSAIPGNISVVREGAFEGRDLESLITEYKDKIVGKKVYRKFGNRFPLLVKFIDAGDNLSVQVHPDDSMARKYHNSSGKTEMWYVLDADDKARLISGFSKAIDRNEYYSLIAGNKFLETLKINHVRKGDAFFIPAGRIHAIGKGLMVAEIQQMSDITYRVYDFDRTDSSGQKRELHIDKAAMALNFSDTDSGKINYNLVENRKTNLVNCSYFNTDIIKVAGTLEFDYSNIDSFRILICVEGSAEILTGESYHIETGETILVPAEIKHLDISSVNATILEVHS